MSKADAHAELRPVPKRAGIAINVITQLAISLIIFGGLNYLGYRNYWRWDLSPNQDHTLSESTINLLRKLSKDIQITVALPRDAESYADTRALVEEYRRNGKKRIRVEFVDPARDYERAEQLKVSSGIALSRGGILLQGLNRTRFIGEDEIMMKVKVPKSDQKATFYRGEDAITSGILGILEGAARKFYFVGGKGSRNEQSAAQDFEALVSLGKQQNFDVQTLNFSEITSIPTDANGLILAGMRYDLTERELAMVQTYFSGKRAAIFVMLNATVETPRLDGFLTRYGVRPRGDRVLFAEVTSTGPKKQFEVEGMFSNESVISKAISDASITLAGQTESLELRTDDPTLKEQSVIVLPLIAAAPRYWGETEYLGDLPVAGDMDVKPPVHLAASIERGASSDQRVGVDSSRMVVVANSLLLDPATQVAIGRDFVSGSLNWMMNREKLIGPTPKVKSSYRIHISDEQHARLFWMTALAMPGVVLALGFLVWAGRRSS